jgi:hypothetical protein
MSELSGQIPRFLENFLSKPASALPKGAQWLLKFEGSRVEGKRGQNFAQDYSEIIPIDAIKTGIQYEPAKWDIERGLTTLVLDQDYHDRGCMFVQAVQIPGESTAVNPEGLQTNGYIRSTVGAGRDSFPTLQVVFLETNVSFVDNVIRPWVVATSNLGLIARRGKENYRCCISAYKLGVIESHQPPFILQKFTFFGACPISVSGEEYNYSQTNSPINRESTFTYHYYNVENLSNQNQALIRAHYGKGGEQIPVPLSTSIRGYNIDVMRATR